MDPFDDFDPQDFDYDESDQDDDIVYVEGHEQGEDPFLPYLAKDVELSQSQFSQPTQSQQETAVPNLLPRRERQRRRTEAAAQLMEESSDSELSKERDDDGEDAFASLQTLLEKQSQLQKERPVQKDDIETGSGRLDVSRKMTEQCAAGEDNVPSELDVPMQDGNHNLIPQVESQFPVADDDDCETSEANPPRASNVPFVSGASLDYVGGPSSISSDLTRELQRHRKHMNLPSQSVIGATAVDSNLLSELKRNRKRAQQQKKTANSRPKKTAAGGKKKIGGAQFHRKTQVTSSKSIVGSRPQHWAAARSPAPPAVKPRKLSASPKSSHLAAAARPKTRPRASQSQASKRSFLNQQARSSSDVSKISFAPHFFHTKQSTDNHDAVEDAESSQGPGRGAVQYQTPRILQRFNQSSNAAYSAGSSNGSGQGKRKRKQASKKLKAGPLMKRLRALRSAVDGDVIRFQSGTYPFVQSVSRRFDMKDPRNRATSYMDVSIICEPVPWDEHERITALGFVHNSERVAKSSDDKIDIVEGGRFAWVSFTYATAREQNVHKGSQLRIYNTVCVPSNTSVQIDGCGDDGVVVDQCCDKTILCSQLCESYPDSLPELPDVRVNQVNKG